MRRNGMIMACVCAATALVGVAGLAPARAMAASTGASAGLPAPAPVSQTIEIDGRFVLVEFNVTRVIGGAPLEGARPVTTVFVNISINDGGQLPGNLHVVGVRFEKLRGVNRFFFTPTHQVEAGDPGPEVDFKAYQGDLSSRASVQFLRSTVRLETDTEVIKIPFGVQRVNTLLLP